MRATRSLAWCVAWLLCPVAAAALGAPLADAVQALDRPAIRSLLAESTDVNAPQVDGMTGLHWAALHDELEIARLLVEAGARAAAANRYGITPLTLACTNGNGQMVELLLDAGADPNTKLPNGETVLMTASRTGKIGPVKSLLRRGADPKPTVFGMGRREGAGANAFLHRMNDPAVLAYRPKSEQTALIWAAAEGHAEVVAELIEFGADFRRTLESGFTPLFFAVRGGHIDAVRTLVEAGADVNVRIEPAPEWRHIGYTAKPRPGATPLLVAVENGHFQLAAYLLHAGADPNAADLGGYTALHAIVPARRVPPGDANPPPVPTGNMTSLEFVGEIVRQGADLNARMTGPGRVNLGSFVVGPTPFLGAAQTADIELMTTLVHLGADPLLTDGNNSTALMLAGARLGTDDEVVQVMELLLDLGVDINAVNANGETAMHAAAYRDRAAPIKFLAARGARIETWNRANRYGSTPLALAAGYQGTRTIRPHPIAERAIREVMASAGVTPADRVSAQASTVLGQ